MGIRDFEDSRRGVEKFSQVREVNVRAHMIRSVFMDGIQRCEIDLTGDSLAGLDSQRWLSICTAQRRDRLFFTARDLKAQPGLPIPVVKFNIASGQIRDGNCRHDRFVCDVLQSLEFQVDLNLGFDCSREKDYGDDGQGISDHTGK